MTDREKAIVMAYTGATMLEGGKFSIFHKYIEDICGRPIYTHEIAFMAEEIKEKTRADFIELCREETRAYDCISRQEAIENIRHAQVNFSVESDIDFTKHKREVQEIADGILNAQTQVLEKLLSVTPREPKTGRWERHYSRPNVYADLFWHCSTCGYKSAENYANVDFNFCPNCGAKMEVEHD